MSSGEVSISFVLATKPSSPGQELTRIALMQEAFLCPGGNQVCASSNGDTYEGLLDMYCSKGREENSTSDWHGTNSSTITGQLWKQRHDPPASSIREPVCCPARDETESKQLSMINDHQRTATH